MNPTGQLWLVQGGSGPWDHTEEGIFATREQAESFVAEKEAEQNRKESYNIEPVDSYLKVEGVA